MFRTYHVGMRKVSAHCEDCNKHWEGLNTQGIGAIHARKYGHKVAVEIYQCIIYGIDEKAKREEIAK